METRIKYIKTTNNGGFYAVQGKKWLFWKTIEIFASFEGAERFLNILKDIDEFNNKINPLNKVVYDGWAVRNVYKNSGPSYSIGFFNSLPSRRKSNDESEIIWQNCNGSITPTMEIKTKKLFGKECLEPMRVKITIEQIEE